jgi:homoserine kinase
LKLPVRKTEYARSIVPRTVQLKAMVANVANASLIVSGFARGDVGLIGTGMVDRAVEEARKALIPGYEHVRRSAIQTGAAGVCISGAGPSMLAVLDEGHVAPRRVLDAMVGGFKDEGVEADGFITKAGKGAARIGSS